MNAIVSILNALPWFAWIAIVAIISGSLSSVVKMLITHHERIEMIRQGMNPDAVTAKPTERCEV
jgi:cation transporter-like permease